MLLSNKLQIWGDQIVPDLTLKQWFLLLMISKIEGQEKNINVISSFVGSTRQNIKKMLVPLEKKGYVIMQRSQKDSRSLNIELSDKSYRYFNAHEAMCAHAINILFSGFGNNEIESVIDFIQKLLHSIEAYNVGDANE